MSFIRTVTKSFAYLFEDHTSTPSNDQKKRTATDDLSPQDFKRQKTTTWPMPDFPSEEDPTTAPTMMGIFAPPPGTPDCSRQHLNNTLQYGGESYSHDLITGNMCASGYLQVEHAEAKKELLERAGQKVNEISNSPEAFLQELRSFETLPQRISLKGLLLKIAKTVSGTSPHPVQVAIEKLSCPSKRKWPPNQLLKDQFKESLKTAYYNYYISIDENLWFLNAEQNAKKNGKEFLEWLKEIIITRTSEKAVRYSNHMSEYLYYWYELFKEKQALSYSDFLQIFTEQCEQELNPFETDGILEGLIQKPESSQPLRKICIKKGSYTFAESLNIWYIKTHSPDIRTASSLGIVDLRSTQITTKINNAIRLAGDPEEKKRLQNILENYLYKIDKASKEITAATIEQIGEENPSLQIELEKVCNTHMTVGSPSGKIRTTPLCRRTTCRLNPTPFPGETEEEDFASCAPSTPLKV